ncbi:MAG: hypothetical protein JXP73_19920 [Deltaproteobacteria bacterium]|nr:hypothetical protein [Deltaproteobacteria bacterium]
MRRLIIFGWLAATFVLAACSSNLAVPVGGGCSSDDVCLTGFCILDTDASGQATHWEGGYCSGNCQKYSCPQGSCLTLADGKSYCVATCATDGDCRQGYICARAVSACLPDCRLGWSCGDTLTCNIDDGSCVLPAATP